MDKEEAFRFFWQGYKTGQQKESFKDIERRAARTQFEVFWSRNYE